MSESDTAALRLEGKLTGRSAKKFSELAKSGDKCFELLMILQGSVKCRTVSNDGRYSVEEVLHAPFVIEPWRLFGLSQRYASTYVAMMPVMMLVMKKNDVMQVMSESLVFRANYLNIVATKLQKTEQRLWHPMGAEVKDRLVQFIKNHCVYPAGHKTIHIQMKTMARELGCSRLEVSNALHELEDEEKIIISRERIEIPMLEIL